MNVAPAVRIGLRYVAGALVAKGVIDADLGSQVATNEALIGALTAQAELIAGAVIGGLTELAYAMARRFGWSK
jgi:hypothetical protein